MGQWLRNGIGIAVVVLGLAGLCWAVAAGGPDVMPLPVGQFGGPNFLSNPPLESLVARSDLVVVGKVVKKEEGIQKAFPVPRTPDRGDERFTRYRLSVSQVIKEEAVTTGAAMVTVTEEDANRTIARSVGQKIEIRLASPPSPKPAQWGVTLTGESVKQEGELRLRAQTIEGPGGIRGMVQGGRLTAVARFVATKAGKTTVKLEAHPRGNPGAKAVKTFTVTVDVRQGGAKGVAVRRTIDVLGKTPPVEVNGRRPVGSAWVDLGQNKSYVLLLHKLPEGDDYYVPASPAGYLAATRENINRVKKAADVDQWNWGKSVGGLQVSLLVNPQKVRVQKAFVRVPGGPIHGVLQKRVRLEVVVAVRNTTD